MFERSAELLAGPGTPPKNECKIDSCPNRYDGNADYPCTPSIQSFAIVTEPHPGHLETISLQGYLWGYLKTQEISIFLGNLLGNRPS